MARTKPEVVLPFLGRLHPVSALAITAHGIKFFNNLINTVPQPPAIVSAPPLSVEQQQVVDSVMVAANHHRLHGRGACFLLHGGPGTGKSQSINGLKPRLGARCLLSATTSQAAFLIGGDTIHRLIVLYRGWTTTKHWSFARACKTWF